MNHPTVSALFIHDFFEENLKLTITKNDMSDSYFNIIHHLFKVCKYYKQMWCS